MSSVMYTKFFMAKIPNLWLTCILKPFIRIGVDMWQKLDRNDISLIAGISINDFVAKESGFMEIVYDSNLDVLIISYGNYIPS